jgi:diadenylate cyclase
VIIGDGRIRAASCYLPLTTSPSLSRTYGTRHRAAIGITEESDALAIVVSEELGTVSLAENGRITTGLDARGLQAALHAALFSGAGSAAREGVTSVRAAAAVEEPGDV